MQQGNYLKLLLGSLKFLYLQMVQYNVIRRRFESELPPGDTTVLFCCDIENKMR